MYKRLLALVLSVILLVGIAAGCKKVKDPITSIPGPVESTPTAPVKTTEPTPEPTKEPFVATGLRGYIVIPNTNVDYPVMIGEDNDYYLGRDNDGNKDVNGSIYFDYRNRDPRRRRNMIIYGHNMKSGQMFATLHKFEKENFFNDNSYLELEMFGKTYEYEIVYSGMIDHRDYYFISTAFKDEQSFIDYFTQGAKHAQFVREGYMPSQGDEMVTLITCVSHSIRDYDYKRLIVVARKVKEIGDATRSTMEYDNNATDAGNEANVPQGE